MCGIHRALDIQCGLDEALVPAVLAGCALRTGDEERFMKTSNSLWCLRISEARFKSCPFPYQLMTLRRYLPL